METIWKVFSCFVALLFLELCNGLPLDLDRSLPDGHTQLLTGLIAVLLTICGVVCLAGCLCCQRRNGFKEFRDSPVVISVASNLDHGHVNPIANGGEFTIFTPLSPPHHNNNVFLANQQVITRAEEDFKNGDIDVTSWFDSNEKDFPRTRLKYIKEFGKGWFGRVVEGTAQGLEEDDAAWTPVIVRILEASASSRQRVLFLHDAKIYKCPRHPNLLRLLGRSLESIPLLLLQEHLTQGDLKLYLRKQKSTRETFLAGELPLRWCHQLAAAVKHLHDHNITHPDLAARNCQISEQLNLKLGDYGCSTTDYPEDYYHGTENVPVRWCAPECVLCTATTIQTKNVTMAGNIWSLGVCLWEIYECGEQPYSNLSDDEVVSEVLGPPNVRLPKPSYSVLYTDYVYKLMQMCWSAHEFRPSISQIDLMLVDLVQVHKNSADTREDPPVSIQDFDARWENFKPNDIVKEDNHILQVIEPENDLTNITVLNMSMNSEPDSKKLSASLHNLAGSFDNLLESGKTEPSWANNSETEDLSFTNAIRDLDSALAAENITSSSDSSPKIKFKLGPVVKTSLAEKSSSESETEDELWRKKIEKGVYTEKVRIKSRSVADLMVLTHIDYSESDSETPLTSLDYANLKSWGNPDASLRNNYKNVRYGPKLNLESSLTFGSEGNLLSVQDTFQQELKKLQEERRDSLLFVPDNKILTSSPETQKVLENLNSPANLEPQNQVFNVYNCVTISPKYSPIHKTIEYTQKATTDQHGVDQDRYSKKIENKSCGDSNQNKKMAQVLPDLVLNTIEATKDIPKLSEIIESNIELMDYIVLKYDDLDYVDDKNSINRVKNSAKIVDGICHEKELIDDEGYDSKERLDTIEPHVNPQIEDLDLESQNEYPQEATTNDKSNRRNDKTPIETITSTSNDGDKRRTNDNIKPLSDSKSASVERKSTQQINRKLTSESSKDSLCDVDEGVRSEGSNFESSECLDENFGQHLIHEEVLCEKLERARQHSEKLNGETPKSVNTEQSLSDNLIAEESVKICTQREPEVIPHERSNILNASDTLIFEEALISKETLNNVSITQEALISKETTLSNVSVSQEKTASDTLETTTEEQDNLCNQLLLEESTKSIRPENLRDNLAFEEEVKPEKVAEAVNSAMLEKLNDSVHKIETPDQTDEKYESITSEKIEVDSMPVTQEEKSSEVPLTKSTEDEESSEDVLTKTPEEDTPANPECQLKESENSSEDQATKENAAEFIEGLVNIETKSEIISETKEVLSENKGSEIQVEQITVSENQKHSTETSENHDNDQITESNTECQTITSSPAVDVNDSTNIEKSKEQEVCVSSGELSKSKTEDDSCSKVDVLESIESTNSSTNVTPTKVEIKSSDECEISLQKVTDVPILGTKEADISNEISAETLKSKEDISSAIEIPDTPSVNDESDKINKTREFLSNEIGAQNAVNFDLNESQDARAKSCYLKPAQENSVILGASDDYSIDYYSGLKTTNCEESAPRSSSPDMKYSLETWDNFLGRSFDEQREFDGFSTSEPQSMLFVENQECDKVLEKRESAESGRFAPSQKQSGYFVESAVEREDDSDEFPPPPSSIELVLSKEDRAMLSKQDDDDDDDEMLNKTYNMDDLNRTYDVMNESGNNVVHLSDINVEMEDSMEDKQGCDNPGYWENENAGGWFLHPQSGAEDLSGQMDVSEDDSYVGFSMDDEIMAAIRNELLTKLPQAQRASAEQIDDGDGEFETTDRNEVFVRYNCYNTPLSPIPEESYSEILNSGQSTPHCTINTDLGDGDDSDWSEPGIDPNSILDDDTHSPRIMESPHKGPLHRHTPSQDSCCSNDTLFNLEELQYTEKMLEAERNHQFEEMLSTERFNRKEKMLESIILANNEDENSAELKTPTNEDTPGKEEFPAPPETRASNKDDELTKKNEKLAFILKQNSEERTSLENMETIDSSLPSSTDNTTTRILTQVEINEDPMVEECAIVPNATGESNLNANISHETIETEHDETNSFVEETPNVCEDKLHPEEEFKISTDEQSCDGDEKSEDEKFVSSEREFFLRIHPTMSLNISPNESTFIGNSYYNDTPTVNDCEEQTKNESEQDLKVAAIEIKIDVPVEEETSQINEVPEIISTNSEDFKEETVESIVKLNEACLVDNVVECTNEVVSEIESVAKESPMRSRDTQKDAKETLDFINAEIDNYVMRPAIREEQTQASPKNDLPKSSSNEVIQSIPTDATLDDVTNVELPSTKIEILETTPEKNYDLLKSSMKIEVESQDYVFKPSIRKDVEDNSSSSETYLTVSDGYVVPPLNSPEDRPWKHIEASLTKCPPEIRTFQEEKSFDNENRTLSSNSDDEDEIIEYEFVEEIKKQEEDNCGEGSKKDCVKDTKNGGDSAKDVKIDGECMKRDCVEDVKDNGGGIKRDCVENIQNGGEEIRGENIAEEVKLDEGIIGSSVEGICEEINKVETVDGQELNSEAIKEESNVDKRDDESTNEYENISEIKTCLDLSDNVYENIEEMNIKNAKQSLPDYVNVEIKQECAKITNSDETYANAEIVAGDKTKQIAVYANVESSSELDEIYANENANCAACSDIDEIYYSNESASKNCLTENEYADPEIYDCVPVEPASRSENVKLNPEYVNNIPTYVNDTKVKSSSSAQYVNTQPEYENHTEIPIVYENMNYDVYIDLLNDDPEVEYDHIGGSGSVEDVYGPLTDIRFTGPGDSQMMTTSFSDSNDLGDEQDWDSGSDTRSSSSGEFIWKEGEHEASVKALHAAPQDAESQQNEVQHEEDDSSSGSEEDCEGPEFVPSAWDKHLAPTKSALRSPEKTEPKKNRGVSFKKQKYHCVYEYPREPESPIVQGFDIWQNHPNNPIDWDVDRDTEMFLPAASSDTEAFGEAGSSSITQPQNHSNKQHRNLYQTSNVPDFIGSSILDDDFYISSSAKPFDMFNTASSQFFPGRHCDWSELIKNNDNITPDSGVEDITPGSLSDSSTDYIRPVKQILPLKTLAQLVINNSKGAQTTNNEIGGLRHTRNRLKLDLPPSPSAFTKSFSLEPVLDVVNRQIPTFTTFGKSRFVVQQVDTPTDDSNAKNVSFEALPYKPLNIEQKSTYKPINVYTDEQSSHLLDNPRVPKSEDSDRSVRYLKADDVNSLTTHIYKDDQEHVEKNRVEIVRGEASLLDSADEDSGIESCTLERKRVSGIPLK